MSLCGGKQLKTKKNHHLVHVWNYSHALCEWLRLSLICPSWNWGRLVSLCPLATFSCGHVTPPGPSEGTRLFGQKGKLWLFSTTTVTPAWSAGPCNHTLKVTHTGSFSEFITWTRSNSFLLHVVYYSVIISYWEQSITVSLHSNMAVWLGTLKKPNQMNE